MNSRFVVPVFLLSSTLVVADETSELQESITTALVSATNDPDRDVRFAAFSALKDQPPSDAIVRAFRRGLEDDHINVRQLALTKMVDYEGPTDEVLKRLISAIGQRDLDSTARKLLIEIGEPAAPLLFESLKSGKTQEKMIAVDILGRLDVGKHRKEAVTEVTEVLKDGDRDVRIAAITALKRMADTKFGDVSSKYVNYAKAVIAKFDANKDGVLTGDERDNLPQHSRATDYDKDGRITPQELARYLSNQ